jgi:hypothetical protein
MGKLGICPVLFREKGAPKWFWGAEKQVMTFFFGDSLSFHQKF